VFDHRGSIGGSWDSTGTDLVTPFLVAALIFGGLSGVFLGEFTFGSVVVLGEVALQFMRFTVIGTGLAVCVDEGEAVVLLLVLILLDGVVPSR
jgi:hypothetical protein